MGGNSLMVCCSAALVLGVDDQWGEWNLVTPEGEAMEEGA